MSGMGGVERTDGAERGRCKAALRSLTSLYCDPVRSRWSGVCVPKTRAEKTSRSVAVPRTSVSPRPRGAFVTLRIIKRDITNHHTYKQADEGPLPLDTIHACTPQYVYSLGSYGERAPRCCRCEAVVTPANASREVDERRCRRRNGHGGWLRLRR